MIGVVLMVILGIVLMVLGFALMIPSAVMAVRSVLGFFRDDIMEWDESMSELARVFIWLVAMAGSSLIVVAGIVVLAIGVAS